MNIDLNALHDALGCSWGEMADALGISERQLRRYRSGASEVPRVVQLALEGLRCRMLHKHRDSALDVSDSDSEPQPGKEQ